MPDLLRSRFRADTQADAEQRLLTRHDGARLTGRISSYEEAVVGDSSFTITELTIDGAFELASTPRSVCFGTSTGEVRWRTGRRSGDLSAAPIVVPPGHPVVVRGSGRTHVTSVGFDHDTLSAFAEALYGVPTPISFDGPEPASEAAGRRWVTTATFLRDGGVLDNDLTRASAYRLLAVTSLESFRLSGDRATFTATAEARLDAYRRAYHFIDDHVSLPITTADIAAAAGLSEADLALAFRAHSSAGLTPYEELRRARLAAAHRDLLNADPTRGDTVRGIAARWGFPHPGRFARLYRATYSQNPKHDLDR